VKLFLSNQPVFHWWKVWSISHYSLVHYIGISKEYIWRYTTRGNLQILFAFATYGQVYPHLVHNPLDVATMIAILSSSSSSSSTRTIDKLTVYKFYHHLSQYVAVKEKSKHLIDSFVLIDLFYDNE
jgi:hypothetical protein